MSRQDIYLPSIAEVERLVGWVLFTHHIPGDEVQL